MGQHPRLHAQLRYTDVWRRFVVPRDASFDELHQILQLVMGWEDEHLHAFRSGKRTIATHFAYEPFDGPTPPPSDEVPIAEHLGRSGARCEYEYDFGDGWVVDLKVEALMELPEDGRWLLGGELAGPPEDCGGVPGYERLREALETGT